MRNHARSIVLILLAVLFGGPAAPALAQTQSSAGAVVPGSVDNEVHISISNASRAPLIGLRANATELPPGISNLRIEPTVIDRIEHDRSADFTILFDVAPGVPEGELGAILFEVTVDEGELETTSAKLDLTIAPVPDMSVCVIRDDAPEDFPAESAVQYCDPDYERVPTEYDRVAVFVTPPYSITEPPDDSDPFMFEVRAPNGDQMASGTFAPKLDNSTPLAEQGSPGRFAMVFDLWQRTDNPDPTAARRGPGTYSVRSVAAEYGGGVSTFGQGDTSVVVATVGHDEDGERILAEWEELNTFEVQSMRLHFQGFVMESVNDIWIPDRDDIWEGKLTVRSPAVAGSTVTIDAEAWIRDAHIDGYGRRPEEEVKRTSTQVVIEFPEELAPGHEEMGEIHSTVRPGEQSEDYFLTAGMHLLIPTTQTPPDRFLVENGAVPAFWAHDGPFPDDYCNYQATGQERFTSHDRTGDMAKWVWQRTPLQFGCDEKETAELDVYTMLLGGDKDGRAGDPEQALLAHLHNPDTRWVIPVFINLTDDRQVRGSRRTLEMKTYGYAIYGAEPGTYDGPPPTGSPPVGDGPDETPQGEETNPGQQDPDTGNPPTGNPPGNPPTGNPPTGTPPTGNPPGNPPTGNPPTGTPPLGDPPTGDPVPGNPTSGDPDAPPGAVNPSDPDTAALIQQWINVAEPPQNATEGAHLRYNHRGRLVGTAGDGSPIEHREGANLPFDPVYLWTEHRADDSIDHCTMEEYVEANLTGESITGCAGRYVRTVAVPRVQGMPIADAVAELQRQGLEPAPALVGAAPTPDLSGTVAEQRPSSTLRLEPGSAVELDVYSDYVAPGVPVPDVVGLGVADAQQRLRDAGLEMQPSLIGAAPSPGQSGTVAAQRPAAADLAAPDSAVEIDVYSDYVAPGVMVPDVRGMTLPDAVRALTEAGLGAEPTLLGSPSDASQATRVDSQRPQPGATVSPETAIEIGVWGDYVPPLPPPDPVVVNPVTPDPVVTTPPATILPGNPPLQCPGTSSFGSPLGEGVYGWLGFHDATDYGYMMFRCEWLNAGSNISTFLELTWYIDPDQGERFCGAQDSVSGLEYLNNYQPSALLYGGSRRVQAKVRWHHQSEQDWIFGLARRFIATAEPYAQPCATGTIGEILQGAPQNVCPANVGAARLDPSLDAYQQIDGSLSAHTCTYRWPDGSTVGIRGRYLHRAVPDARNYCAMGDTDNTSGQWHWSILHSRNHAIEVSVQWLDQWGRDNILAAVRSYMERLGAYAAPCQRDPP